AQQHPQAARPLAETALPKLEAVARDARRDVPALEALGHALRLLDRPQDALKNYEEVLAEDPQRETALAAACAASTALQQFDAALGYAQRALAVNPYSAAYHAGRADLFARRREWAQAE